MLRLGVWLFTIAYMQALYGIDTIVVKTYAIGLYIDEDGVEHFQQYHSLPPDEINSSKYQVAHDLLFKDLLKNRFDMTLR